MLPEEGHLAGPSLAESFPDIEGFHLIDMTDAYCIDGVCPTIIGNIYVWGVMLCVDSGTCGKDLGYVYAPTPPRVLC